MRHCYIRLVIGLIWLVAAVICAVNANISMMAMYGGLCVVFLYTAYSIWKKEKQNGR